MRAPAMPDDGDGITQTHGPKVSSVASKIVLAAGALLWQMNDGIPEVLLVHRPSHDDWSIPKGKLDRRETFPGAAVREVEEETGYAIRLHRPLPSAQYPLGSADKLVHYWVATVRSRRRAGPVNKREVDKVRWFPIEKALKRVTMEHDRKIIEVFAKYQARGEHVTSPLIVLRHCAAVSRSKWRSGDEMSRPLAKKGRRQAAELPPLLGAFHPKAIVSSPWQRTLDSVMPFADAAGLDVVVKPQLTESAHEERPSGTAAVMSRIIDQARPTLICTHRPVLRTVFQVLRDASAPTVIDGFPSEDPFLQPGEMFVAHVTDAGHVVATEKHLVPPR